MDGKDLAAYLAQKGFVVKSISTMDSFGNTLQLHTEVPDLPKCPAIIRAPFSKGLTGVKFSTCGQCNKSFANNIALGNHLRVEHLDVGDKNPESNCDDIMQAADIKVEVDDGNCFERIGEVGDEAQKSQTSNRGESSLPIGSQYQIVDASFIAPPPTEPRKGEISYIIIKTEPESDNFVSNGAYRRSRKVETRPRKPYESRSNIKVMEAPAKSSDVTGPFCCVQCPEVFETCCEYSRHFHQCHAKRRKAIQRCQICEKRFDTDLDPILGVILHPKGETVAPFSCDLCGKSLPDATWLEKHRRINHGTGHRPYQCKVCCKGFNQPTGLSQHMKTHSAVKPFVCEICHKSFTQKAGLDQHFRIHSKVKPFACVVCGKAFTQSAHLSQHMRVHTKIEPFECSVCQRRFKQSSHLNFHLKSHEKAGEDAGGSNQATLGMYISHGRPIGEAVAEFNARANVYGSQ